jgi:hypothetical protein
MLSNALIINYFGFSWLVFAALVTALIAYLIEFNVFKLCLYMNLNNIIKNYIIIFLAFLLFTGIGSPVILFTILLFSIVNLFLYIKKI